MKYVMAVLVATALPLSYVFAEDVSKKIGSRVGITKSIMALNDCSERNLVKRNKLAGTIIDGVDNAYRKGKHVSSEEQNAYRVAKDLRPLLRKSIVLSKRQPHSFSTLEEVEAYEKQYRQYCEEIAVLINELN